MITSVGMVTVDAVDPVTLAAWWAERLGGTADDGGSGGLFVAVSAAVLPFNLGFQKVAAPTPGKNRLHLDLQSTDRAADVQRFLDAGATYVDEHEIAQIGLRWTVLTDPGGNQFCIGGKA